MLRTRTTAASQREVRRLDCSVRSSALGCPCISVPTSTMGRLCYSGSSGPGGDRAPPWLETVTVGHSARECGPPVLQQPEPEFTAVYDQQLIRFLKTSLAGLWAQRSPDISIRRIDDSADLVSSVHWSEGAANRDFRGFDTICELVRLATYATGVLDPRSRLANSVTH